MPYLLFIIIFSIFLLLKIPHPLQHLFQMMFFLQRYALAFLKGTGIVLLSIHFSNSLGLCHELAVLQERSLQSMLVNEPADLKCLACKDDANRFKDRRR